MQAASLRGLDGMVETLLVGGVDANAEGGEYGNALSAASFTGRAQIIGMLLNWGVNVNARGGIRLCSDCGFIPGSHRSSRDVSQARRRCER